MLQSVTGFLQQMSQIRTAMPEALPLCGEMLQEVVRTYRCGRTLENSIDEFIESAKEAAEAAKNAGPPPDPKQMEMQGKIALENTKAQNAAQLAQLKASHAMQIEAQSGENDAQLEIMRSDHDVKMQEAQAVADIVVKSLEAQFKRAEAEGGEAMAAIMGGGASSRKPKHEVAIRLKPPGKKRLRINGPSGLKEFEIEDVEDQQG
jgi:pyruvate/2-oxoglutarate dehydrogenase complex dihydrolipoamide acyltransferase (E2) component